MRYTAAMSSDSHNCVFTIPSGVPFLHKLAATLLENPTLDGRFPDTVTLADYTILLPTRRAVRALQEVLLELKGGQPLLLPAIRTLGDVDVEELSFTTDSFFPEAGTSSPPEEETALEVPPSLPGILREIDLLKLVRQLPAAPGHLVSLAQATSLTADLATFLDQVQTEEVDLDRLTDLVPEQFSDKWQQTLFFLDILRQQWPLHKAELGRLDPSERRTLLIDMQRRIWQATPPVGPVLAAGSTGSIPATARLLATIAGLPMGAVVLPGLDKDLPPEGWARLADDPAHPQAGLFHLCAALEVSRAEIADWPGVMLDKAAAARQRFLNSALWPAELTGNWVGLSADDVGLPAAFDGMRLVEAADSRSEAGVIALALREALEDPDSRAILVTPDRTLARRVAAELQRWEIYIDDTAGEPLARRPVGVLARLVLAAVAGHFTAVELLSVLKHPLARGNMTREVFLRLTRRLEKNLFRGAHPPIGADGLAGLARFLENTAPQGRQKSDKNKEKGKAEEVAELAAFLRHLDAIFKPLTALQNQRDAPPTLAQMAEALQASLDLLAPPVSEDSVSTLWQDEAGEALLEILRELGQVTDVPVSLSEAPVILDHWLSQRPVRDNRRTHPRLAIMGLLEARLVQADLVVLGGLNEGVWPSLPDTGPWLSRPMRSTLGMTAPERRIGLAAHDFVQAAAAPRVLLTRAKKTAGKPMVAARWLTRMQALTRGVMGRQKDTSAGLPTDPHLPALWQQVDRQPEVKPMAMPAPCPPLAVRPKQLSVTQIEKLQRDPYAIYARHILRLKPLDPLDADMTAAARGSFIHLVLENFIREYPDNVPENTPQILQDMARELAAKETGGAEILTYWWPRFEAISHWFNSFETSRRPDIEKILVEQSGALELDIAGQPFKLTAKADRIECLKDGRITILDYKTGAPPSNTDIKNHRAPQMTLEGAIAKAGGFDDIPAGELADLLYVHVHGGFPAGGVQPLSDPDRLADDALAGLQKLLAIYADEAMPYVPNLRPDNLPYGHDYDHLARVLEWSTGDQEES